MDENKISANVRDGQRQVAGPLAVLLIGVLVIGFCLGAVMLRRVNADACAMVVEAIDRAHAYAEAGADGLFAPGLADITLIARLAEVSPLPLNIMVGDATPPLRALAEHGVARVSHGPRPYLMAMKALEEAARAASA